MIVGVLLANAERQKRLIRRVVPPFFREHAGQAVPGKDASTLWMAR